MRTCARRRRRGPVRATVGEGSDRARVFSRQRSVRLHADRYEGHAGRSVGPVRRALHRAAGRSPCLSPLTYPPVVPAREPARWWTLVLAVAGGLLTRLAFPEPGWWGTAFLGVALLYLALRRDSARWNALVGLVWGLAFFLPLITLGRRGRRAGAVARAQHARGGVLRALRRRVDAGRGGATPSGAASACRWSSSPILFVATEELAAAWPFGGFPWGRLGVLPGRLARSPRSPPWAGRRCSPGPSWRSACCSPGSCWPPAGWRSVGWSSRRPSSEACSWSAC